LLLGGLLLGCGASGSPWWVDLLVPDSPCYRVDLVDGLDPDDTSEEHDLFACLDQDGLIAPLAPLDAALDVQTRSGTPVGLEIAGIVGDLGQRDLDPFSLAGVALDAVGRVDFDPWLDLSLELVYGAPAADVRSGAVELGDPRAIDAGVLGPLADVIPATAGALLDDDLDAAELAGGLVQDPKTDQWVRTIASVLGSTDPAIHDPLQPAVQDLGVALLATRSPENDRWAGASGDSLRDLVQFFAVQENPVVDQISPPLALLLADPAVRDEIVPTIDQLEQQGHLAPLGAQAAWLASVDVDGTPLEPGEASALYRFTRLLATNNQQAECSIGLIHWSVGNLSVSTLRTIAGMHPGQVQDLASVVSSLTGNALTLDLLETAIDTGLCPTLTHQTLDDLQTLSVITQPEAYDLLSAFVAALAVMDSGDPGHLAQFADVATALFYSGGLEPAEEAVRDLGPTAFLSDVTALVPPLVHPDEHGITASGGAPATLDDLVDLAQWVFEVDATTGLTGSQRLRPLMATLLARDGTWDGLGNFARVAADGRSTLSTVPALVPALLDLDPDLTLLHALGPLLGDRELAGPVLRIAERDEWTGALFADSPSRYPVEGVGEVPLAFWGRLVTSGALEDVLRLVHSVLAASGA
jgi:hypothetical protein